MSLAILDAMKMTGDRLPLALKPAILGAVTQAQRNHLEITGRKKNRNFFYREAEIDELRRGLFRRTAEFYFSFGFASRQSGDLIEQEMQSWFDLRKSLQGNMLDAGRTLWDTQEETDALLNALRSAIVNANRIEARFVLIQMRRNIDTMLRLCDTAMPGKITL